MSVFRVFLPALRPADDAHADHYRRVWREARDYFTAGSAPSIIIDDVASEVSAYTIHLRAQGTSTPFATPRGPVENLYEDAFPFSVEEEPYVDLVFANEAPAGGPSDRILRGVVEQLYLAMNLAAPGCFNMSRARLHRIATEPEVLAPTHLSLDAEGLLWAWAEADENRGWPLVESVSFGQAWEWLQSETFYSREIALRPFEKALFALLQLSRRDRADPDNLFLAVSATENILMATERGKSWDLQQRLEAILGAPNEHGWRRIGNEEGWKNGKWIATLYHPRNQIAHGSHPIPRPGWHNEIRDPENRRISDRLQEPIDLATAVILALLQDLIQHRAYEYVFKPTFQRK